MRIAIGSDHPELAYTEQSKPLLQSLGHEVRDFGTNSESPVDYPAFLRSAVADTPPASGRLRVDSCLGGEKPGQSGSRRHRIS